MRTEIGCHNGKDGSEGGANEMGHRHVKQCPVWRLDSELNCDPKTVGLPPCRHPFPVKLDFIGDSLSPFPPASSPFRSRLLSSLSRSGCTSATDPRPHSPHSSPTCALSRCLSVCLSLCVSVIVSLYASLCLCLSVCLSLSLSPSLSLSLSLSRPYTPTDSVV